MVEDAEENRLERERKWQRVASHRVRNLVVCWEWRRGLEREKIFKGDLESVLLAGDKVIFIASGNLTQICIWIIGYYERLPSDS